MKPLISICQFSGVTPFSFNQNTLKWQSNPSLKALSIALIIYNGLILLFTITFPNIFIVEQNSEMVKGLFLLLLILNQIHAIIALVELFFKGNRQIEILNTFFEMDFLQKQILNEKMDYKKLHNKCLKITCVWFGEVFGIFIIDLLSYFNSKNDKQLIYLLLYIPSYIVGELSYAYSVLLTTLAYEYLDLMNRHLIWMNKRNGYYISERFIQPNTKWNNLIVSKTEINMEELYFIKRNYWKIWEATKTIKYLTFWSLHMGISNESFVLTFNSFLLVSCIFFVPKEFIDFVLLSVMIANNLVNLLFICYHNSKIDETVSKIVAIKIKYSGEIQSYYLK